MAKQLVLTATLASLLAFSPVWGAVQRITLYERPGQQGEGIILTKKHSNISDLQYFFNSPIGSYCVTGWYYFYANPNFEYTNIFKSYSSKQERCANLSDDLTFTKSIRYMGPENFSTPAVAFYEGPVLDTVGTENVVTGPAGNNFEFSPKSAFLYGDITWTLFTGNSFDGDSICIAPAVTIYPFTNKVIFNSTFIPKSVVRGCDSLEVASNIRLFNSLQ